MASTSSSTPPDPNITLQPTYAGFPVFLAKIFATRVAKSILLGEEYSEVLRGSEV